MCRNLSSVLCDFTYTLLFKVIEVGKILSNDDVMVS